jgi:tetratricopeptide (TPR) repeat protein
MEGVAAASSRTLRVALATMVFGAALGGADRAHASPESEALRTRAAFELYNLDHARAVALFREAVAADPQDAAAHRGVAIGLWMSISFTRGNMTIDDYLGGVARQASAAAPAPPELAAQFHAAADQALALGRTAVKANPKSADAHYDVGAAYGLLASYIASVEGSASRAFRAARSAYDAHEEVLNLDPRRKDAGHIVGVYRYIVSVLALPLRWAAYVAGFGGGKERGIRMIEDAIAYGGANQDDARFSLVLVFNRERRYDLALRQLEVLRQKYTRNRLLWLETGSTLLRAGRAAAAERMLDEGIARSQKDGRQRMFGEEALWHYKRGAARARLKRRAEAESDLRHAIALEGRKWVHGRAHLELGRLFVEAGDRQEARRALQTAASLCDADNDRGMADEARRLLRRMAA